jgi:hypothetical protein
MEPKAEPMAAPQPEPVPEPEVEPIQEPAEVDMDDEPEIVALTEYHASDATEPEPEPEPEPKPEPAAPPECKQIEALFATAIAEGYMGEKDAGGMTRGLLGKIAAGKATEEDTVGVLGPKLAKMKELYEKRNGKIKPAPAPEGEFHRAGPHLATWHSVLTETPYQRPELCSRVGLTLRNCLFSGGSGGSGAGAGAGAACVRADRGPVCHGCCRGLHGRD